MFNVFACSFLSTFFSVIFQHVLNEDGDDVCVCLESCYAACNDVSYLWGGLHYTLKVSEPHEGDACGAGHAILVPALPVSFIRLQRRYCPLQEGDLSFISLLRHFQRLLVIFCAVNVYCLPVCN